MIELTLPYPPSVNSYWRSVRVGNKTQVMVSAPGRKFQAAVKDAVILASANKQLADRLYVRVILHPADARKRDIDNCLKSLLDAMGKAGVYLDDSQVDQLVVLKADQHKGGQCKVFVSSLDSPKWLNDIAAGLNKWI